MPIETRGAARKARSAPNSESELSSHEPSRKGLSPPPLEARKERTLDGSNSVTRLPGHPSRGVGTSIMGESPISLTTVSISMEPETVPGARDREGKHRRGTDNPSIQDMFQQILLAQQKQNDNLLAVIADQKQEWQEALQHQHDWVQQQIGDLRLTIKELSLPRRESTSSLPTLTKEEKTASPASMDSSLGHMSLPIMTSSSDNSSSPAPPKREKQKHQKKQKKRKKKRKKKSRTYSSSSSSSSDETTYFPKKNQSTILLAIKKSDSLQDRSSALHWLIRFRQMGKNMRWTEKQQTNLLPLCWTDEKDEAKTLWSQTIQRNTSLTLLEREISLLETFDPDGIYQMQNALATEKQPVNMKCTTWWASILHRWESLQRWSDTASDAYQTYRKHTLKRNFRNKAIINLLDSTPVSTLTDENILSLCLRADKLTFRNAEVEAEVYRLRGQVRAVPLTAQRPRNEPRYQARAANPNRRKLGITNLDSITHKGNIFGRHHERDELDGCCWFMCPEGCNRTGDCLLPHINRKPDVCPAVFASHEDCPRGIHCSLTHPNGKYIGYFESRSTPGKFTKYEWTIPPTN